MEARRKQKAEEKSQSTWCIRAIVGFMAFSSLLSLYLLMFPDTPPSLSVTDTAKLREVLYGGKPAFVRCENSTTHPSSVVAFENAARLLRAHGISSYSVDCAAPLKKEQDSDSDGSSGSSGSRNIYDLMKLERLWNPAWFVVANGRRAEQLPPSLTKPAELEKAIKAAAKNSISSLSSSKHMEGCLRDRAGGCFVVWTSKQLTEVRSELAGSMEEHRNIAFAALNASILRYAPAADTSLARAVKDAVAGARAVAQSSPGARGAVLLYAKRVPGSGGNVLAVVGAAMGAAVTEADVAYMLARHAAAWQAMKAPAGEDVDPIEALLERESRVEAAGGSLVPSTELAITYVPTPKKPAAGSGSGSVGEGDSSEAPAGRKGTVDDPRVKEAMAKRAAREGKRQAVRDEAAAARGGAGGAGGGAEGELSEEELQAQYERRRRAAMQEEEANSAFVAHAAEDGEGEGEDGHGGGSHEEAAEEVVDLDSEDAYEL